MGCTFLDEKGEERPMVMGCYGIGVTRIAAAAIEQNHDADGIVWPMPIAPFQVHLLSLQQDAQVVEVAERLHGELEQAGVEVLYDDRDQRPGVKFKDADLLGMPLRIAVGKKGLAQGGVELRPRKSRAVEIVAVDGVVARVTDEVARGMAVAQ
jgi:prolyl-tRNA synthetase